MNSLLKLSILIPVYNWDISQLMGKLNREIKQKNLESTLEIILIDDGSSDVISRDQNKILIQEFNRPYIHYLELKENVGRGLIRGRLVKEAKAEYLLFLDCDVIPDQDDFISRYLTYLDKKDIDVVYGGISYLQRIRSGKEYDFYLYLSQKTEVKKPMERNIIQWRHLHTANIMIRRSVMDQIPFDNRFRGYGYEDSEWGIRATRRFKISHIDNTVSHLGLISKSKVYERMRESVSNYLLLSKIHPESFRETQIDRVVKMLKWLPNSVLIISNKILKGLFSMSVISNTITYIIFQLNKAILITLESKNEE